MSPDVADVPNLPERFEPVSSDASGRYGFDVLSGTSDDDGGNVHDAHSADDVARLSKAATVVAIVLALVLGAVLAALGTATHRTIISGFPVGLVLALAMTLAGALLARAWRGMLTLAMMAAGWLVAVQVLSLTGSGGDVLLADPSAGLPLAWLSVAFSWGGLAVIGAVAFLPRRWFDRFGS